jgi:membrane-associated protease RseP (regulator of RpoE activity)
MPTDSKPRRTRTVGRLLAGSLGAFALTLAAGPIAAQEAAPAPNVPTAAERRPPLVAGQFGPGDGQARLGIYLQPGCGIDFLPRGGCDAPPIVASVVDGAPAAEAGVQTGDTLVALDGVSLGSEAGRRSLGSLRDGESVTLRIGRSSGRRDLRVTPTARPLTGQFVLSGPTWRSAAPSNVQVFRLRDEQGGVSEFHFTPSPVRPEPSGRPPGFVVFEADEHGVFSMGFGRPDVEVFTRDGRRVELEELERRIREGGNDAAREFGVARVIRAPGEHGIDVEVEVESLPTGEGRTPSRRLILEDAQLAQRLVSVHEQSLAAARIRIDSILHVRGERRVLPAPDAPAPSTYRLAGAEFQTLTSELAEYFAVDTGVLVLRVIPETPADRLGLRGGDVVVEVDGRATNDVSTLRTLIAEALVQGLEPEVKWNRKGTELHGNLAPR